MTMVQLRWRAWACTYLGINGKWRVPAIRRYDLDDAVFLRFFADALDVLNRILELFRRRSICLRLLEAKHAIWLWWLVVRRSVASALDGRKIERLCLTGAQRNCNHAIWQRTIDSWHRNTAHS